jgi:hypothetical protein
MSIQRQAADKAQSSWANALKLILFWSIVGAPLTWGVTSTLKKAAALFQ